MGDTIFIFCLALILFGPKKLPEIGRQIGKLMVEFRRASNEFKMQIEDELRASEETERQKEISAATTMLPIATAPIAASSLLATVSEAGVSSASTTVPVIAPPSTGVPVNHTFTPAERNGDLAAPAAVVEDAYPEAANGLDPALNTASNGVLAEIPAVVNFPTETFEPVDLKLSDSAIEKTQAPVHHG